MLATRLQGGSDAKPALAARAIAEEEASCSIGTDAVAYLGESEEWTSDANVWFQTFVRNHPNEPSGALAADIVMTHVSGAALEDLASTWQNDLRGTSAGLAASFFLIRAYTDSPNPEKLAPLISTALSSDNAERLRTDPRRPLVEAALDALGRPYLAARLHDAAEKNADWAEETKRCLADVSSPQAEAEPLQKIRSLVVAMFAADFATARNAFFDSATALSSAIEGLASSGQATSQNDDAGLFALIRDLVDGLCRRSQRPQSLFYPNRPEGGLDPVILFDPCQKALRNLVESRPDSADSVALLAAQCAQGLAHARQLANAESFYQLALDCAESPNCLADAAIGLADMYWREWQAPDSARAILQSVIAREDAPARVHMALTRLLYQQERYDEVVQLLSPFYGSNRGSEEDAKVLFILGAALRHLGRYEEMTDVWKRASSLTTDESLRKAIAEGLSLARE